MENPRLTQLLDFLKADPKDSFLLYAIALEYAGMNDTENSLSWFERLRELNPDYLALYYHYGKTLEKAGRTQDAIPVYQAGINLANAQRNFHTKNELQAALQQAQGETEEW